MTAEIELSLTDEYPFAHAMVVISAMPATDEAL
jgi:phosphopantetheinyl transferase (holo-ACP synthase)